MTTLTPEELDEARAREAHFRAGCSPITYGNLSSLDARRLVLAARLAREGWTTPDPDLLEAREVCAKYYEGGDLSGETAARYRSGHYDDRNDDELTIALAAIKRGRELQSGSIG